MLITEAQNLSSTLMSAGIINDVIDEFVPATILSVKYGSRELAYGERITVEEGKSKPTVKFVSLDDSNAQHVLLMVDPDAPSRANPVKGEWCHWIVSHIASSGDVETGTTLIDYNGPAPPHGTGDHRYVVLLYRQPSSAIKLRSPQERFNFRAREYAKEYNLQLIAAHYFVCKLA